MKRFILFTMIILPFLAFSQKKKNGNIYIDHPAITVVESMFKTFIDGDTDKVASYLTEDFRSFNGLNRDKDAEGGTKQDFLNQIKSWHKNYDYLQLKRTSGAYPDALEYKDENNNDIIWVQTWNHMKGVNNYTGVKLDMPIHRLFAITKENKIKTMISYVDRVPFNEIRESFSERKNGTVYSQHEYINKVRRMMAAIEFKDLDKAYSFYHKNASFADNNSWPTKFSTLEENRKAHEEFTNNFDITSVDVWGYPDYIQYEKNNFKVVQSWWKIRLIRKEDKKKIVLPIFLIHFFNDDGMITAENAYFSEKLLE